MNFIQTICRNFETFSERHFVTEMHGINPVPFSGEKLARMISQARAALRIHRVRKNDRVVLIAPNSAAWIAVDLAVLAEGAAVVPMYARQDPKELIEMIQDADPALVIVHSAVMKQFQSLELSLPVIQLGALFGDETISNEPIKREADDVATMIYTSGTSGVAKGVMLSTKNVDYMLKVTRSALERLMGGQAGEDRIFHYLPFCFAGSRITLWTTLLRGCEIKISTDLENLVEEMQAAEPHYFLNVPALLERIKNGVEEKIQDRSWIVRKLYQAGQQGFNGLSEGKQIGLNHLRYKIAKKAIFDPIRKKIGKRLKFLICGSAPLGPDTQAWFEMLGISVYQVYGLTETTAIVTMDEPGKIEVGRVGHAIEGCEIKIGEGGELLCKGPNIFKGYWNKAQETSDAFIDGWFRTGDQTEVDANGNYKIIGRVKNILVPSSGHNVAPEPLEQKIVERTIGVEHAVVVGHARSCLTAIVSGSAEKDAIQQTIDAMNKELPHYKRVRDFYFTQELFTPENGLLTANQKLRRAAIEDFFKPQIEEMYASL